MAAARPALSDVKKRGTQLAKRRFEPVWRHVFNAQRTKAFRAAPPQLCAEGQRLSADLARDGFAKSSLEALTGDATLLPRLQELAHSLEQGNARLIAEHKARLDSGVKADVWDKPFVVELLDKRRPEVEPDGLLASVALHPQLRGIADTYFGLRVRVSDINIWRSLRTSKPAESSQLWHKDLADDFFVLKMFVYLEDVDEGGGPFTYLRGSHRRGDLRDLRLPEHDDGQQMRGSVDAPEQVGVGDRVEAVTGPAGTVLFADTLGYHRGGWARTSERLLMQVLFTSNADIGKRKLAAPAGVRAEDWADDLAYA
ncbi:phytanoyl-CoA dioxygenase PhyH [Motilibacter peucedani]|uniref:Phytanoyl-CoA dioxygenase PhyH n=1 Tax=Motilibacter peucedani TaxID=598650 RepID=A0A420XKS5_9ACTN|nr:phytanoyl-CoA dioxygenase family protein [Motilibacter peucedani]RKS68633.1 phytanoyl-CoA dioxygenase PhyH [Motilibacter peucedani]